MAATDDPPPLTPIETVTLSSLQQEGRAIDAEIKLLNLERERWQSKVAAFKAAMEKDRPGFTWSPESGAWTPKPKGDQ